MTRAAAYLRVSSAEQRDRDTIANQRRDVPAYIAGQGWTLAGIYEDDGRSAWTGKLGARAGYAQLIADARARRFDVVVVASVSRLTRSGDPSERAEIVARLDRAGVKVAIVGVGIQDPRSLAGDLFLSVMGVLAAAESRIKSEQTIAGHITAAMAGRPPRGVIPYGLRFSEGRWDEHPRRAGVVRDLFERVAAGQSTLAIADELDARGIESPRGGRWTHGRVRGIVKSDAYLGRWTVDKERALVVPVPALVDADLAIIARAAIARRRRAGRPRTRHLTLLAGVAVCALCRASIGVGDYTERGAGIVHGVGYRCAHRRRAPRGGERCGLPLHYAERLDARVWESLVDALANPATADRLLRAPDRDGPDPTPIREEADRLAAAQAAVLAQLAEGLIDPSVADATIRRLAEKRKAAEARLVDALSIARGIRPASSSAAIAEAIACIRADAGDTPMEERRALLRAVAAEVVLHPAMAGIDLNCDAGQGSGFLNMSRRIVRQTIRVAAPPMTQKFRRQVA